MTTMKEPRFVKEGWLDDTKKGWVLKPGAPKDIKDEFRDFMKVLKDPIIINKTKK